MSAIDLILALVIGGIAAGLYAVVSEAWSWRAFVAMWVFGVALLLLPAVIHP